MPVYDTREVASDAETLRARLVAFGAEQDEALAGRSRHGRPYATRSEAKAAARRGQAVREGHGLAVFFLVPPTIEEA